MRAAARKARTPSSIVGSWSGAYCGEWFTGISAGRPREASVPASCPAKAAGSAPPKCQNTEGTPSSLPNRPKSSLPLIGCGSTRTPCSPSAPRSPSIVVAVASSVFSVTGKEPSEVNSGSLGEPEASASARTILRTAASTRSRTTGSTERMLSFSSASSAMMFSFVPAWIEPTVTTAVCEAPTSRETTV